MKLFILPILLVLVLAACGGGEASSDGSSAVDPDGDWVLIDGMDTIADFPITLSIEGNQVSGRAACNSYGGTIRINGTAVAISELFQTEMGCQPEVMEAEQRFLAALASVDNFSVDGTRLTLSGSGAGLGFEPVTPVPTSALVGTTWVLDTLIEGETASTVAGDPATLLLSADGTLTASTGCRTLTGTWLENGGVIVVPNLSADGECPDDLWKQDSLVVTVIEDEFSAEVEGNTLTLTSMGGDGLVYRSEG